MDNFLQFELWKDCNNRCAFCFNDNSATSAARKLERLAFVKKELTNNLPDEVDTIGFIGGEFFDGQLETEELFSTFIDVINLALNTDSIKKVLITSSLIFRNGNQHLKSVLLRLTKREKLMLCTSWDTKYRFHTEDAQKGWENTIKLLHELFPEVRLHVEICPTQWHLEDVLADKFNIAAFENKYGVRVDYTDLNSGFNYRDKYEFQQHVPGFFPKRETFLRFLNKVYGEGQARADQFLNYGNMSTLLWMEVDGKYQLFKGYRGPVQGDDVDENYPLPPMHETKSDYIDSHVRMRADVLNVWEEING